MVLGVSCIKGNFSIIGTSFRAQQTECALVKLTDRRVLRRLRRSALPLSTPSYRPHRHTMRNTRQSRMCVVKLKQCILLVGLLLGLVLGYDRGR